MLNIHGVNYHCIINGLGKVKLYIYHKIRLSDLKWFKWKKWIIIKYKSPLSCIKGE